MIIMIRKCLPAQLLPLVISLACFYLAAAALLDTPTSSMTWPTVFTYSPKETIFCGGTDLKPASGMCNGPGFNAGAYGAVHPVSHPKYRLDAYTRITLT